MASTKKAVTKSKAPAKKSSAKKSPAESPVPFAVSHDPVEVVFSFDTTGSMYPCLTQVRRSVEATTQRLFDAMPNLRIGVISHGDYCDGPKTIQSLDLTTNKKSVQSFVKDAPQTNGGDSPECYELALRTALEMNWSPKATKVFVLIGDELPHGKNERQNKQSLDWREEAAKLGKAGIKVYGVQALGREHATKFYETISEETGGHHIELDQFQNITDIVLAIAFKQQGAAQLQAFEQEVKRDGRMSRSLLRSFDKMLGRKVTSSKRSLDSVDPSRFQVLKVDEDTSISEFVEENGLPFRIGRGFYEFMKPEKIQAHKEVVIQEKATGDMYTGDKAREMAGIPKGADAKVTPSSMSGFRFFVQSTSSNRKLIGGTRFLYEA